MTEWGDLAAQQRERNQAIAAAAAESRDTAQSMLADLRKLRSDLAEARRTHESERAEGEEARAEVTRRGDHGPDLQSVQRRVDAGQTTWRAVWTGEDTHASALRVRATAETNLGKIRAHVEEADPRDDEAAEARQEALRQAARNRELLVEE